MRKLTINVKPPYDVVVGGGLLDDAGKLISEVVRGTKALIISDSNTAPLYGKRVADSLSSEGLDVYTHIFEAGEKNKTVKTVWDMLEAAASHGLTRSDAIIALGGGVTGDMAGFAAAVYLRGIDYIQIPTTVIAQSDSSVGGKTGCDLTYGKNLAGAFKQPRLVIIDSNTLNTLPQRYKSDGMAEVIKHGLIASPELFDIIESGSLDMDDVLYRNVDIKRSFVEADEFDTSERMKLNFGHTMGHAIEKYYNFTGPSHGEAVAMGMVIAAKAGEIAGLTKKGTAERICSVLKQYNLPTETKAPADKLIEIAALDKKRMGDIINFILISDIGHAFIHNLRAAELSDFLQGAF